MCGEQVSCIPAMRQSVRSCPKSGLHHKHTTEAPPVSFTHLLCGRGVAESRTGIQQGLSGFTGTRPATPTPPHPLLGASVVPLASSYAFDEKSLRGRRLEASRAQAGSSRQTHTGSFTTQVSVVCHCSSLWAGHPRAHTDRYWHTPVCTERSASVAPTSTTMRVRGPAHGVSRL